MNNEILNYVFQKSDIQTEIVPCGNGHINDTYLTPVRPDRSRPRKRSSKTPISFLYIESSIKFTN